MAIFKKSKDYEDFLKKNQIESQNSKYLIKGASGSEFMIKIIMIGVIIYWSLGFIVSEDNGYTFLFLFATSIPIAWIFIFIINYDENKLLELDNIIFDNFLSKKLKIFYSKDEVNDYNYNEIKHISKRLKDSKNPNQIIIELSFDAFLLNSEG